MPRKLYLFNPDHDLALANGDENFNSPQSALAFAKDLACFPMWYAAQNAVVLGAMPYRYWMGEMQHLFPQLASIIVASKPDLSYISSIHPWGWNGVVAKMLCLQGVAEQLVPDEIQLTHFRRLSHRETAIRAMRFLCEDAALAKLIPQPAQLLSATEIAEFVETHRQVIFKAPWSSSGKGLCWANGSLTDSIIGWCRNIVEKQGAVVAEQTYDKVQDFAMEFLCDGGEVSFAGYSLFHTERGVYRSNELMSDKAIFDRLTQEWIDSETLLATQNRLKSFVEKEIAPYYKGYLGVDMFVFRQDDTYRLHPCVEINLRMTMGMVARIFFDQFVDECSVGKFYIDHYPAVGMLQTNHLQRQSTLPLSVVDGRITNGYLSLSPISKNSHYRARIEIG